MCGRPLLRRRSWCCTVTPACLARPSPRPVDRSHCVIAPIARSPTRNGTRQARPPLRSPPHWAASLGTACHRSTCSATTSTASGDWQALEAKRGRRFDARLVVSGGAVGGRRRVVIPVNVACGAGDSGAARALTRSLRCGAPSSTGWPRSVATFGRLCRPMPWCARAIRSAGVAAAAEIRRSLVVLTRRVAGARPDSLRMSFASGAQTTETPALVAGVVRCADGGRPGAACREPIARMVAA